MTFTGIHPADRPSSERLMINCAVPEHCKSFKVNNLIELLTETRVSHCGGTQSTTCPTTRQRSRHSTRCGYPPTTGSSPDSVSIPLRPPSSCTNKSKSSPQIRPTSGCRRQKIPHPPRRSTSSSFGRRTPPEAAAAATTKRSRPPARQTFHSLAASSTSPASIRQTTEDTSRSRLTSLNEIFVIIILYIYTRYFVRLINIFWLYIFSKSFRTKINTSDKKKQNSGQYASGVSFFFSLKLSDAANALLIEPLDLVT